MSTPPRLQDFLTGSSREQETRITGFRQRSPGDGTPISQDTSAYLSYDDRALYVVFVCKQDPGHVRARMAKRENIDLDDQVSIYLDTFQDRRRAYVFETNPLGIQRDGILTEGQGDPDYNFDTVWHSQAQLMNDGFVVWIAIPFKSLRFNDSPRQTWGIAFGRTIVHTGEEAFWPYITSRVEGFVQQMATLEGMENVSRSQRLQFIPYGNLIGSRFLDTAVPQFRSTARGRGGLDTKYVAGDAFTFDLTLNPDFSEVESDDPQVLVNQRYEVFFPEKRPFFIENAGFFQTPENLFFSRRIADPEVGARLTGKAGPWAVGALVSDDRAPGRRVLPSEPGSGSRAVVGVFRLQREVGNQSSIGLFATDFDFGSSFNRVLSLDARFKLSPTWVFSGQVMRSFDRQFNGNRRNAPAYLAVLTRNGRHMSYVSSYVDRSAAFRAPLGFIQRVDIRQINQSMYYSWRPTNSRVLSYGPSFNSSTTWDHKGGLTDWSGQLGFSIFLKGPTQFNFSRTEYYELFQLQHLRQHSTLASFYTSWVRWMGISGSYIHGVGANYSPPAGLLPFTGNFNDASFGLTLRPLPRFRFDQTYLYSQLSARSGLPLGPRPGFIFNNHISRSKLNYQFSRALSLRAIVDYNGLLSNPFLAAEGRLKRLTGDVLFTYLLNPGTALYVGYTDRYQNLAFQPGGVPGLMPTAFPGMSIGRQIFVKVSYLLNYGSRKREPAAQLPPRPASSGAAMPPTLAHPAAPAATATVTPAAAPPGPAPSQTIPPPVAVDTQLRFSPPALQATVSGAITVNLIVDHATDLFAAPMSFKFDPTVLRLDDIVRGELLSSDGKPAAFLKNIQNQSGEANVSISRFPGQAGITGSGTLVTLVFHAVRTGGATMTIPKLALWNSQLAPLSVPIPEFVVNVR